MTRRFDPRRIHRREPSELEQLTTRLVDGINRMTRQLRSIAAVDLALAARQAEIWHRR